MNIASWTANDWICGSMTLAAIALLARFVLATAHDFVEY